MLASRISLPHFSVSDVEFAEVGGRPPDELRRITLNEPMHHAYGVFRAAAIPSTSLASAGVCLGNTRALVACSKS